MPWFLAGNGIALQCIATAATAAAAASQLPPSAVQGRGGSSKGMKTVNRGGANSCSFCTMIQIDSLGSGLEVVTIMGWKELLDWWCTILG